MISCPGCGSRAADEVGYAPLLGGYASVWSISASLSEGYAALFQTFASVPCFMRHCPLRREGLTRMICSRDLHNYITNFLVMRYIMIVDGGESG